MVTIGVDGLELQLGIDIRSVDGGVAAGGPARAPSRELRVIHLAYHQLTGGGLDLGVAFEAEIVVAGDQHLAIDGPMRLVAAGAAVAHRLVLVDKGPRLGLVTTGAGIVLTGHR